VSPAVRRVGGGELVTTAGRPSGVRLLSCTVAAAGVGVGAFGFTAIFLVAMARERASVAEIAFATASLSIFYSPTTLWTGGWWTVGAILAVGVGAAALTHRYGVAGVSPVLRRGGQAVLVLLLSYGTYVLVIGVASLAYVV
jgi:hypothetical protein